MIFLFSLKLKICGGQISAHFPHLIHFFGLNLGVFTKINVANEENFIVQTTDNEYYLTHSFNKSANSSGWVFMDYRNNKVELIKILSFMHMVE